jgi:protein-S-isoprenylcysteine O-methyltransferase Ste14
MNDESNQDSFCSMARDLYSRKNLATLIWVWANSLVFLALAVLCAVLFFTTDQTRFQIMYAAIFICCVQIIILAKIVCWQTMHRNSLKRQIKRLELLITESNQPPKDN